MGQKVVVSGSFRKHLDGIRESISILKDEGLEVLSTEASEAVNPDEEFVVLESDDTEDPKTLEQNHLNAIREAEVLYIYNKDGYIGDSATLEMGYALALNKKVFMKEEANDQTLSLFCDGVVSPENLKQRLDGNELKLSENDSLPEIQQYIDNVCERRGFEDEDPLEIALLMVEELGELSEAIREEIDLKTEDEKEISKVSDEVADILIYLLHLCSQSEIDAFEALYEKEERNKKRSWS